MTFGIQCPRAFGTESRFILPRSTNPSELRIQTHQALHSSCREHVLYVSRYCM